MVSIRSDRAVLEPFPLSQTLDFVTHNVLKRDFEYIGLPTFCFPK